VLLCLISTGIFPYEPLCKSFDIRTENTRPRIIKLFLDHKGLIWVGTDNGVFTFDGINFNKIFNPDKGYAPVSSFFEDKEETIWVGFENGKLIKIKNNKTSPFYLGKFTPITAISAIEDDNTGRIYFSTHGEGMICYDGENFNTIDQDNNLSDNYCYDIQKISESKICVGTDAGINFISYENNNFLVKEFSTSDGLPDDVVRTMALDSNNTLWLGFQEYGIAKFDCNTNKLSPFNLKKEWSYGQVNDIIINDNILWVATEEHGIVLIDKEGIATKLKLENERALKVTDLLADNENNIWISESINLLRTSGNKLSIINAAENKSLDFIHCIASDKKGRIWFSPNRNLASISKNQNGGHDYKEYKILDKHIDIVTLYVDSYGYIWIGTMGEGVFRFNPESGSIRKISETGITSNSNIMSINGTDDVVWVAGFNSVIKLIIKENGDKDFAEIEKEQVFEDSPLKNDYVYSVFIDSKKNPWFATDENGIYYYKDSVLKNIPVHENAVHSFTEDNKGRIWFSTADAGIFYFDTDNKVKKLKSIIDLSDPSPSSLLSLITGDIVVVHSNGFDLLNPESGQIIYHSSEENLSAINNDLNSIVASEDNKVWIGTERGILVYNPLSDKKLKWPKTTINSVSVFLEEIDLKSRNEFDHDENNLRFDYCALWYSDPQRIIYRYVLEGYSNKWELTRDQNIIFPKLPPGDYVFKINASLNGIFDDSFESSFAFVINPPVWQQWWFRIAASGIVVLFTIFMVKRRDRRLRNFDRLQKENIEFQFETLKSQVNPHFLFNSFNTLISIIESTPTLAVEYVERLSEFFRNIVNVRDKNLILLSEEIGLLDNYIFIQKKRYGDCLKLETNIGGDIKNSTFIAPLTLQLLAENAIKHNAISKETPLVISIESIDGKLCIRNNINPKMSPENSTGFGLENINKRYELLTKVKVEVIREDKYFLVYIPLLKNHNESSDH
jgi:ligand-binding sensor domain-containing protein